MLDQHAAQPVARALAVGRDQAAPAFALVVLDVIADRAIEIGALLGSDV